MLELQDVVSGYGRIYALHGISLTVEQGRIVTVVGPNGAGKSTTLKTIAGLLKPEAGSIKFEGRALRGLWPAEVVKLGISLVPEGRKVFSDLSVEENMRIGAYSRRDRNMIDRDLKRMFELFPLLQGRNQKAGGTLSGGEQQMLAIARALMSKPKLLMMDEPSLGLAPLVVDALFRIIKEINILGTTILLVEQNAEMALTVGHDGYVMETGTIVMHDACENLLHDEKVQHTYLGVDIVNG